MNLYYFFVFVHLFALNCVGAELQFESDVRIKKTDQSEFVTLKSGDKFQVNSGDNFLIINTENFPMLVIAAKNDNSQITITNKDFQQMIDEQIARTLSSRTSEILDGLRKAESFLIKKDFNQALTTATQLKEKYPFIAPVLFLRATTLSLMSNNKEALTDLEKGLEIDPKNSSAIHLQKKIKESK